MADSGKCDQISPKAVLSLISNKLLMNSIRNLLETDKANKLV